MSVEIFLGPATAGPFGLKGYVTILLQ